MCNSPLCNGCGTCVGVCPTDTLGMRLDSAGFYRAVFDGRYCTSCGLCVKSCPVLDFSERVAEAHIHIDTGMGYNPAFGYYSGLYIASSTDTKLRFDCSSGGFVTSLLLGLLHRRHVDQAVVVRRTAPGLAGYASDIVNSDDAILGSRGSKYVPIQRSDSIRRILREDGRFAFVGLPCHVAGLIRAMQNMEALRKKIRCTIALFCGGTSSLNATRYLLHLLKINEDQVETIDYRGNGWPGDMTVLTRDGRVFTIPYRDVRAMGGVFSSVIFRPLACAMCSDPFGRLADVSAGDAWLKRFKSDKIGTNIVIARRKEIDDILHDMGGEMNLEDASEQDVLESNYGFVKAKYHNLYLKAKYFEKIYGQPYKAKKESFRLDQAPAIGWNIFAYLMARKCLSFLTRERYLKAIPLPLIKAFKAFTQLERKSSTINKSITLKEPQSGRKTVLIINHLSLNKGNHAILRTILQELKVVYGDAVRVVVSSYDKQLTESRDGVESFFWPLNIKAIKSKRSLSQKLLFALKEMILSLSLLYAPSITKRGQTIYDYYRQADLVVSPGGHLFTSMNNILVVLNYTLSVLLAKKLRKPVVGLAQSVGPFAGKFGLLSQFLTRKALLAMDKVLLREDTSVGVLKAMGIPASKYGPAGEVVYLLERLSRNEETFTNEEGRLRIGVTIHHIYFKYYMSKDDYVGRMSNFFNSLMEKHKNATLLFIPMEYTTEGPRDRLMINEIVGKINNKAMVEVLERDIGPEEILALMGQLGFFIGTKTHSIVMALQSCVPTLSISYHEKSKFFMNEWGVGDYSIYLKDISAEKLSSVFDRLFENRESVKMLLRRQKEVNLSNSKKNIELIRQYV